MPDHSSDIVMMVTLVPVNANVARAFASIDDFIVPPLYIPAFVTRDQLPS